MKLGNSVRFLLYLRYVSFRSLIVEDVFGLMIKMPTGKRQMRSFRLRHVPDAIGGAIGESATMPHCAERPWRTLSDRCFASLRLVLLLALCRSVSLGFGSSFLLGLSSGISIAGLEFSIFKIMLQGTMLTVMVFPILSYDLILLEKSVFFECCRQLVLC